MLEPALIEAIDGAVVAELERTFQPGLTLGITDGVATLAVRTYGLADVASRVLVTPMTLFEIGSIGKTFTAVLVLQLVDEGRIGLDEPVQRYLRWFSVSQPDDATPITVAHLLSHTAGIVAGVDATPEAAFQVWSLRELATTSSPGERFHYSNLGYKALGLLLEAVTGQSYPELLQARILGPLGMTDTEPAITHDVHARLAVGYEYLHDDRIGYPGAPLTAATWLQTDTADGSIASTAADMCAFARLLLRRGRGPAGPLLSERGFAQMTTRHVATDETAGYGYGIASRDVDGRTILGHGGGMVGYLAGLQLDPDAGVGAVVLQNGVGANPMALARTAIRLVREATDAPRPTAVRDLSGNSLDAEPRALAGVYRPAGGGDSIELVANREGLTLRAGGRDVALEELDDDLYLAPDRAFDRFPFAVERPPHGPPEIWHGDRRYVRVDASPSPLPEPSAAVRAIAGHYRSHNPWTTNFRVMLRGDQPWLLFAAAPDGFEDQQPLVALPDGRFRVGRDQAGPESMRFDTVVDGRALRAWLSGWPYYRAH